MNMGDTGTYWTGAGAVVWALPVLSPMLSKRSSTSGKKSSSGKMSSASVMKPVVAQERSPKTLSPFSRTGLEAARFRRPTVPIGGARRRPGWGRLERRRKALEPDGIRGSDGCLCIPLERSDLSFRHGGEAERATHEGETKSQEG